jgi:hypothetical protein
MMNPEGNLLTTKSSLILWERVQNVEDRLFSIDATVLLSVLTAAQNLHPKCSPIVRLRVNQILETGLTAHLIENLNRPLTDLDTSGDNDEQQPHHDFQLSSPLQLLPKLLVSRRSVVWSRQ